MTNEEPRYTCNVWDELVPNPNYTGDQAVRQRKRNEVINSRAFRRATAAITGLVVIGTATGIALAVEGGGGKSVNVVPSARSRATARPHKAEHIQQPIVQHDTVNVGRVVNEKLVVPPAVLDAERSVVSVIGYYDIHNKPESLQGTGFVIDLHGKKIVMTAAHVTEGEGNGVPNPNYTMVATNIGGQLREDPITSIQAPEGFSAFGNGGGADISTVTIDPSVYVDANNNAHLHTNNGFSSLPALKIAKSMPKPGTIVYTLGMATEAGSPVKLPPRKPDVQVAVVDGYEGGGDGTNAVERRYKSWKIPWSYRWG